MRSLAICNRSRSIALVLTLLVPIAACEEEPAGPPMIGIGDTSDLPPVLTPEQCAAAVAPFPGWEKVEPVPEYDAQGLPTLWYAMVPISRPDQLEGLGVLGVHVEMKPIFTDAATEAKWAGQTGSITESTCGGAGIVWALVPGPVFNAIKTVTLDRNEVFFDAIIIQPVPGPFANASITYQSMHPASYTALRDVGFVYRTMAPPPEDPNAPAAAPADAEPTLEFIGGWISDAVNFVQSIPRRVTGAIGSVDCWINDCVNLSVRLDVRNTDTAFGGSIGAPAATGPDTSSSMVRAWGASAGSQMQLPGVVVAAEQVAHVAGVGIRTRYEGTTDRASFARFEVGKGRPTSFCLRTENGAAQIRSFTWTREICSFEAAVREGRTPRANTVFNADTSINIRLQNKFFNMLAQFTDGQAYLRDVVGFTARQAKVLSGWAANLLNPLLKGRAVTPCLAFPNPGLWAVNTVLNAVAALGGPIGTAIVSYAQQVFEVDMWMPDGGQFATERTLEDRTVSSHEYGHFVMCSLLFAEDSTKAVQIPSLYIQRIAEGTYMDVGDETTRIMEAFADYFAGQTANGYNYIDLQNQTPSGHVKYCQGDVSDCWDWNYVEDTNTTIDPGNPTQALGTPNMMRRVATTLHDAFDGHPAGGNNPGSGNFWSWFAPYSLYQQASPRVGHSGDEPVVLPGSALRTLIHNWTHASSLKVDWAVNEHQFFGALNATIRNTPKSPANPAVKYSWCDACALFAPHDGRSCASVGATATAGECRLGGALVGTSMSTGQMVDICSQNPIRDFIGPAPAATDPTSACTFVGCPARSILVGTIGEAAASCVACGPHQVAVGNRCVECGANELVGGADGNSCVACPAHQVPNAAKTACVACQNRQVAVGGLCLGCPAGTVAAPDSEICEACPAGELPYNWNTCVPVSECVCGADYCRKVDAGGLLCVDIVG